MTRFTIVALACLMASGCYTAMTPSAKTEAIAYCKHADGYLEFHHVGKYDSSPVIGATCHSVLGSRYFYSEPRQKAGNEQSTVGYNQLGIPESQP